MNTTKLHIISKSLVQELKRCKTVSELQTIISSLEQIIRQPQTQTHQQQLSNSLTQLYNKLEESPVENFSPAWREAMDEMNVSNEFGINLKKIIESVLERNQITQQVALDELKKIHQEIQQTEINLSGLSNGLEYFGIGEDTLNLDECEVGVIIPRAYVENNLKEFGKELVEIEKTLIVFSELATGTRAPLKVRTISSSELSVFLDYIPQIGACIAIAVERIVALYKQMLEIKKLKLELVKQQIPSEKLSGIDEYAKSIVSPKIDEIAIELMESYGNHIDENRKNEVHTELRHSLNKLANRIDRGFNIELRVSTVGKKSDESEEPTEQEVAVAKIINAAKKIEYTYTQGEPVLFLRESSDE